MRSCSKWIRGISPFLLLLSIFVIFPLSMRNCYARENFSSWSPFQNRTQLLLAAPIPDNTWEENLFIPMNIPDSGILPLSSVLKKDRIQDQTWGSYSWNFFSLSLSTLDPLESTTDIYGKTVERDRMEMIQSFSSSFSDISTRQRFQYLGEIFSPELKLKIKF